jgi:hypothetical protein
MPPPKSVFDWKSDVDAKRSDVFKKIQDLIERGEFEHARLLLDAYIPDDGNLLKRRLIRRMDDIIQDCNVDEQMRNEDYNFIWFGGTDVKRYHDLDSKLLCGVATLDEIKELYLFWSAYPNRKSLSYCIKMYKWLIENNAAGCSDLAIYIIDRIHTPSVACFYFLLSKELGFFKDVGHVIEYYLEFFSPDVFYDAKAELDAFKKSREFSTDFLLENNLIS